jgi:phage/plasmid-like protein (TIGR03299 family)
MSHELDYNQATEKHAMISVKQTPWHRLGIVLDDAPDLDLALELAGLNFGVEKVPHFFRLPYTPETAHEGRYRRSSDSFTIIRTDRMESIGTVGSTYQPLQNSDAFGVLRPILEDGVAKIETAGVLRGGSQVWMLTRFDLTTVIERAIEKGGDPELLEVLAGEVMPYGLFTNDHSGKAKGRIKETAIRVVCANTFGMAMGHDEEGTSVEVSHTANVTERYKAAAQKMLTGVAVRYAQLAKARMLMSRTTLGTRTDEIVGRPFTKLVLDTAVPILHLERKIQRHEGTGHTTAALDKAHGLRKEIRELWFDGSGHEGNGSAWEAFQGSAEWIDHASASLRGQTDRDERRAASLYEGQLGRTKSRIARQLLAYAAADTAEKRSALLS